MKIRKTPLNSAYAKKATKTTMTPTTKKKNSNRITVTTKGVFKKKKNTQASKMC